MPQPAYQPKDNARQAPAARIDDDASAFVAPRAPQAARAGQPAPEVMDRLRRAVDNHNQTGSASGAPKQPAQAPAAQSRMSGLGRMLERMAGHGDQPSQKPSSSSIAERVNERVATRARQQETDFDDLASPDSGQDNVEIPAFLRRQAN